jgi:transposase InsO family protein
MYRILTQHAAIRERRAQRRRPAYSAPELLATGPCQVWSWDITKLRGPTPGIWYNLYVVLDIFSRKIVGWLLDEREEAAFSSTCSATSAAAMVSSQFSAVPDGSGVGIISH